jgi:hypothetical protein
VLSSVGIPGLMPIPLKATLVALGYSFVFALWVNDALKTAWLGRAGGPALQALGELPTSSNSGSTEVR